MLRRMTRDRYLSDAELERFMSAVRNRRHVHSARDFALFALIVNTGMRPSEAMQLRRRDLDLRPRRPWLRLARQPLRHMPEPINDIPLHVQVANALRAYCEQMDPDALLWPITKRQAERLFRYYAGKAGLPQSHHLFSLRHTAGMRLYRHSRDVRLIQALMGHRWLKAADNYAHAAPGVLARAMNITNREGSAWHASPDQ